MQSGWGVKTAKEVQKHIEGLAKLDLDPLEKEALKLVAEARTLLDEILIGLSPLHNAHNLAREKEMLQQLEHFDFAENAKDKYCTAAMNSFPNMTRDSNAISQGSRLPAHTFYAGVVTQIEDSCNAMEGFWKLSTRLLRQLQIQVSTHVSSESILSSAHLPTRAASRVFIGHGNSLIWMELKDFIADRLQLPWEEFNRESVAGRFTKERLEEMLTRACFAFIVLTGEDEDKTGALHPRANAIHEVGLFQGRLGFERAIVLLEDGCAEFSNIHGLTQLRFPKGKIAAVFEDVRRVLEREGILANAASVSKS
jgi:predicted nucleotide-binding protein